MAATTKSANGATCLYSGVLAEARVPGGTFTQPSVFATSWAYSFEVAHVTN